MKNPNNISLGNINGILHNLLCSNGTKKLGIGLGNLEYCIVFPILFTALRFAFCLVVALACLNSGFSISCLDSFDGIAQARIKSLV